MNSFMRLIITFLFILTARTGFAMENIHRDLKDSSLREGFQKEQRYKQLEDARQLCRFKAMHPEAFNQSDDEFDDSKPSSKVSRAAKMQDYADKMHAHALKNNETVQLLMDEVDKRMRKTENELKLDKGTLEHLTSRWS